MPYKNDMNTINADSVKLAEDWKAYLRHSIEQPYFAKLVDFIKQERNQHTIYPAGSLYFHAFDSCSFQDCRVVILGQDPYHGPGQAHGLCFSVNDGVAHPPSLQNIFKELQNDMGIAIPQSGNLQRWAKQGILLLNASLTVRAHQAGSHQNQGWEIFTDDVIKAISNHKTQCVFMLWGSYAQKKGQVIDRSKHHIITAPHPSPLSAHRGFFGSKPFSKTNQYLQQTGQTPIEW